MFKSILSAALISLFASSVLAAPAPSSSPSTGLIKGASVPLNQTRWYTESHGNNSITKRDKCDSTYSYNVADMKRLISIAQSDGEWLYVPAFQSASLSLGTARVCIFNRYLFENTHVSHWEAGWGAQYVGNECCTEADNPVCSGGACKGHGDSGLSVIITTQDSGLAC